MIEESIILDHFHNPRNFGLLAKKTHHAASENFSCGDRLEMDVQVEGGRIERIGWVGDGCTLSVGAASILSVSAIGSKTEKVLSFSKETVLGIIGMPTLSPTRLRCALLSLETLQKAINESEITLMEKDVSKQV